jgi:RNA recognition motif-containing protein
LEVKIVYKSPEKGDVKIIKVEGAVDEGREVIVRHENVPPKWQMLNYEKFSSEWSESYLK